jgi:hypothetical protein
VELLEAFRALNWKIVVGLLEQATSPLDPVPSGVCQE